MRAARDMTINLSGLTRSRTLCSGMERHTAGRCVGSLNKYVLAQGDELELATFEEIVRFAVG